ncbi:Ig-like domain-containing protein, partial [Salmonella enterica]
TSNTMTSTTAATNVKATATVSSTTHTGTPVTATTPVTFTADASKATLTVTVTGSRQPTETDTSHTAATADGADLLTLHFKAVDGNGNPVTSTPVHYTTAVTDAGIVKDTLACTTNGSGECTSTVKTTKAGTYNVWVALVPAGAAQPVSPVKTALVFLAGPPDSAKTTIGIYGMHTADADSQDDIEVYLDPRDSHNNVVPLWTFRKDLTIVPSVNATEPGAVSVDVHPPIGVDTVNIFLTYVGTARTLVSRAARSGTATVSIGKSIKQTVDARFYPEVDICLKNQPSSGYIQPGLTEVLLCDKRGAGVPPGSGYTVTSPHISAAGCSKHGGGVCPPDTVGKKADFTNLTGDDVAHLVHDTTTFDIHDDVAGVPMSRYESSLQGKFVYYAVLPKTRGPKPLTGTDDDVFSVRDAHQFCHDHSQQADDPIPTRADPTVASKGVLSGGPVTGMGEAVSMYIGAITQRPSQSPGSGQDLFVAGGGPATVTTPDGAGYSREWDAYDHPGAVIPQLLLFVDTNQQKSTTWDISVRGADVSAPSGSATRASVSVGRSIAAAGWDVSDMYYVNDWPGKPLTTHKPDKNDITNLYVTQVNYVTGYVCEADLH